MKRLLIVPFTLLLSHSALGAGWVPVDPVNVLRQYGRAIATYCTTAVEERAQAAFEIGTYLYQNLPAQAAPWLRQALALGKEDADAWLIQLPPSPLSAVVCPEGKAIPQVVMGLPANPFAPADEKTTAGLLIPVDGTMMSPFGRRKHPIRGGHRHHDGVDISAPRGTPVRAVADGRVEEAGRNGGYGNYIRIDHGELDTAYGHLSRYAPGIRAGVQVEQGQVIGYVGSTGLSTGPHLHYEVIKHGRQVNPRPYMEIAYRPLRSDHGG